MVGGRSKAARNLMLRMGFREVYNLTGGTLLWKEEGLPFASGTGGKNKFSICPFFMTVVAFKNIKKGPEHCADPCGSIQRCHRIGNSVGANRAL